MRIGGRALLLALTATVLSVSFLVEAYAKPPAKTGLFLPPVATINDRLTPDAQTLPANAGRKAGEEDLGTVDLKGQVEKPVLKSGVSATKIDQPVLSVNKVDPLAQASSDALAQEELAALWRATVERNPVIRFALDKLATPADLAPKYSSRFLNRTLNTLITGGAVASMFAPGGGVYRNMGIMTGGDALKNFINGKMAPRPGALSPTEQIQLAGLVDDLRTRLIQSYWDYRSALISLESATVATTEASKRLSAATEPGQKASKTVQYYRCLMEETDALERAKQYHLQLTRLAGVESVKGLKWFTHSQHASLLNGVSP